MATSTGSSTPSALRASTATRQAPDSSGGSSCTTSVDSTTPTTGWPHWLSLRTSSAPNLVGALNRAPSRWHRAASATSARVLAVGGGAGVSSWPAAMATMALAMSVMAAATKRSGSCSRLPTMVAAGRLRSRASKRCGSISAGVQVMR